MIKQIEPIRAPREHRVMGLGFGIAGYGAVGQAVAAALADDRIPAARLTGVWTRRPGVVDVARLGCGTYDLETLVERSDVIVECATAEVLPLVARVALARGRDVICVSAAGLLDIPDIDALTAGTGARLQIVNGTMPALDMLRCAREGDVRELRHSVLLPTRAVANEPYLLQQGLDFRDQPPEAACCVFAGSAREAALAFPRHMNVAVSVSLAGIGFDRTQVEIWLDPSVPGAVHKLTLISEEVRMTLESRNLPSSNPKTSRIVAPSILAAIRGRLASVQVGS